MHGTSVQRVTPTCQWGRYCSVVVMAWVPSPLLLAVQELLRHGVSGDKMADDDKKIADNEKLIANSYAFIGKRYKQFLIDEGFQDGRHLPHYLDACKVGAQDISSYKVVHISLIL